MCWDFGLVFVCECVCVCLCVFQNIFKKTHKLKFSLSFLLISAHKRGDIQEQESTEGRQRPSSLCHGAIGSCHPRGPGLWESIFRVCLRDCS